MRLLDRSRIVSDRIRSISDGIYCKLFWFKYKCVTCSSLNKFVLRTRIPTGG